MKDYSKRRVVTTDQCSALTHPTTADYGTKAAVQSVALLMQSIDISRCADNSFLSAALDALHAHIVNIEVLFYIYALVSACCRLSTVEV